MPSETVSEGIAFVPPFLHHGQCGPVDSSSRFSYPKNPVDSSPRFSSPKKTAFPPSTVTVANPLQYPSRLLFRASLRKPKNPVDSSPRFSSPKKNGFSAINAARQQTRCNTRPDFSSVPLPASRKIRLTVRPAFPLRKKTAFLQSTGTAANPLQYPSRLLLRASPRKPQNPVDSSSRFSSPKKNGFPAINRHGSKPVAIPVPTSLPPHNQRLTLFRLNFYAPYFLSVDSDFFPFLTKRFSGDGFSLFLVGKHQEKHALQTKNDNGHFSVPVSAGQTFPGTLHPVNRIRHPVAAFSRQGANPGHSRRKRGSLQIILPRRHIGKKNSPSLANGEFSDNPEIYHGSLYSRAGSFRRSRFVAPVFSQKLRRVPFN